MKAFFCPLASAKDTLMLLEVSEAAWKNSSNLRRIRASTGLVPSPIFLTGNVRHPATVGLSDKAHSSMYV
jgi:hypothetical protein